MEDTHIFGESDYLIAQNYLINEKIQIYVKNYLGRRTYQIKNGFERKAGYYKVVLQDGREKEWRLSFQNEKLLAEKYNIRNYEELVGKNLTLAVRQFKVGIGFEIVNVETPPNPPEAQAQTQTPMQSAQPITQKQFDYITKLSEADGAEKAIQEFLNKVNKEEIKDLTKQEASDLITALTGL